MGDASHQNLLLCVPEARFLKMSRKLKREFKKVDRMLDKWGFDMDDPIIDKIRSEQKLSTRELTLRLRLKKMAIPGKKTLVR